MTDDASGTDDGSDRERNPDDPAEALEHVVDDLAYREETADWIREQLLHERVAEEVVSELVAQGWDAEEAHSLVEQVRRLTRRERGVVTREDVAREANRRYGKGMSGGWMVGMPTLASARRLMHSLGNLLGLGGKDR